LQSKSDIFFYNNSLRPLLVLLTNIRNDIFFWNSTLKEKLCGTMHCCNTVAGQPTPLMLKAKAETILLIKKTKKMQTKKMSLANIKGKLSRTEMKNIMAGSGVNPVCGTNYYMGQCRCDFCDSQGRAFLCDIWCSPNFCGH
jgi:hypothetical protein